MIFSSANAGGQPFGLLLSSATTYVTLPMLGRIKGKLSARFLGATSHREISRATLIGAISACVLVAAACLAFAVAQWAVSEKLLQMQKKHVEDVARNSGAIARMATYMANTHRATLNALLSKEPEELANANSQFTQNLDEYRQALTAGGANGTTRTREVALAKLVDSYEALAQEVIALDRAGQAEAASAMRIGKLRPLFNAWQHAHEEYTTAAAIDSLKEQGQYERTLAITRGVLAVLFAIPAGIAVIAALALFTALGAEKMGRKLPDAWAR